jgi:glyoxylase-like metal-dependent hydrolase (beta-lactamase superfamily II)
MLSRRDFLRLTGAVAASTPFLSASSWREAASAGTFTELRRGVGIYTERGGTIGWLLTDDGGVVVDTQSPRTAPNCRRGLRERSDAALAFVVNTHHHADHTGGNGVFAPHTERIVAHEAAPALQRQAYGSSDDAPVQVYAGTTFSEEWTETVGDETIRLRHHGPAHTGGDAVLFFERANVVHGGDLIFNRAYPFIDVEGGANTANWIATLETLHETYDDDTQFIFGHGNPEFGVTGDRADLLVMRDFFVSLREYVTQQRQAGASLSEMKQKTTLEGFEAFNFDWFLSLGDCVEAVHTEMEASG